MSNGEALKAWRKAKGLSQAAAAALIEAKQRTWAAWELGKVCPDLDNCIRLAVLTSNAVPAVGWAKRRERKAEPVPPSDSGTLHAAGDDDDHRAAS